MLIKPVYRCGQCSKEHHGEVFECEDPDLVYKRILGIANPEALSMNDQKVWPTIPGAMVCKCDQWRIGGARLTGITRRV